MNDPQLAQAVRAARYGQLGLPARLLAEHVESVEGAIDKGRHAFEMLRFHDGNEVATLAWAKTFLREGADIFHSKETGASLSQELDDLCEHGCLRAATISHTDGRLLCEPCYAAETGGPGVGLCPTCSPSKNEGSPA